MPLLKLSAEEAVSTRKGNPNSRWGDRASENRVEPIARPGFKVPFRIQPNSSIFTVGSCFARHVEDELIRRGFHLPMRDVAVEDSAVLNNYGAPSIYNELAWAFGERPYVVNDHIVEVSPGKYADLHLSPGRRPQPFEEVLARREAISNAYRRSAECAVVIMTLGLVELWFDTRTGYYLNVGPRPSQIRAEPDRFELHVLSFEDCHDYLERAIQILIKHGRPDLRILLTVSPVPLTETHRDEDVIVANMYSKSVLRAVAETVIARHDFISYYPSYESVMYSDRKVAWMDDMVHVRQGIVSVNVGRMVDAFIGSDQGLDEIRAEIQSGGALVAVEKAKKIRSGSREVATEFFGEYKRFSRENREFALEHAMHCEAIEDYEGVIEALDAAPGESMDMQMMPLKVNALIHLKRAREAVALFDPWFDVSANNPYQLKSVKFWQAYLNAALATEDEGIIAATLHKVASAHVNYRPWAYGRAGSWYLKQAKFDHAVNFLEMAVNAGEIGNWAYLPLAEAYAALGRKKDAVDALAKIESQATQESPKFDRLRRLLA
jgi:thioredoxin-like negative regulator of GroEL